MTSEPPGADRRRPPRSSPTWNVRAPLAAWLQAEAAEAAKRHGRYRVLDIGCGVKPYEPFFSAYADEYVGVDVVETPYADVVGPVEALPLPDAGFELVLCNQVLEHCDDPAAAVRELRRVLVPGGRALASTHGVFVYHPAPNDLWRWTHQGLDRLFRQSADWTDVSVVPSSGTAACLAMLAGYYVDLVCKRARLRRLGGPLVAGLNTAGAAIDARVAMLRDPIPGTLFANYHVTADA